jgi:hypothetical protein
VLYTMAGWWRDVIRESVVLAITLGGEAASALRRTLFIASK